jgi:hypothetical protein
MKVRELRCTNCGVEVTWSPVYYRGQPYCCADCAAGRTCRCDYPPEEGRWSTVVTRTVWSERGSAARPVILPGAQA